MAKEHLNKVLKIRNTNELILSNRKNNNHTSISIYDDLSEDKEEDEWALDNIASFRKT